MKFASRFSRVVPRIHRQRSKPVIGLPKPPPGSIPPTPYTRDTVHKITGILRTCPWDTAKLHLKTLPLKWDSHVICKVLKTHPPMEKAWLFFLWTAHLPGFKHDQFTYTTMLDIFGEAGRIASMRHLVEEMRAKGVRVDVATYTSVMNWLGKSGDFKGAVGMWMQMRRKGCKPTVVSYTAFIKLLFDNGKTKEASDAYREMLDAGVPPSCHTYTVFIEHLAGVGKFNAALDIMFEMQEAGIHPDKATCNILVHKCSKAGETSILVHVLHYMKDRNHVLRRPVFLEALKALNASRVSDIDLLRVVNPHLALQGIEDETSGSETSTSDIAASMDKDILFNLLAMKNFNGIEMMIRGMQLKNTKLDTKLLSAIIQASSASDRASLALMAFDFCKNMGKKLDRAACASIIGLIIRMNLFQENIQVVEELVKQDVTFGPNLAALLISRLGCVLTSTTAKKVFDSKPNEHNTVTYTAMIDVCFRASDADMALELYSNMRRKGIPASKGTFQVLSTGLERMGRFQEADVYKKEKKRLEFSWHSRGRPSMEENLCDRLFDGI